MNLSSKLKQAFKAAAEYRARVYAREQMLNMSERQLADLGISRILLLNGISAWPWRAHDENVGADWSQLTAVQDKKSANIKEPGKREIRQAIEELSAYSDRELNQMGINRGSIKEVVRFGRTSTDAAATEQKRAA